MAGRVAQARLRFSRRIFSPGVAPPPPPLYTECTPHDRRQR
nr:MAG TPA: hypothetical protein [Caudoviricetes sp.]